jgi:multiple sugar transport system permease protein
MRKTWIYIIAIFISLWILIPIIYTTIASFADARDYYERLIPRKYTLRYYEEYWRLGVGSALLRSIQVGLSTVAMSFLIGIPAGYAVGRLKFKGRDVIKVTILLFRVLPIVIMAVPLAVLFIRIGLYDTLIGVALIHAAIALPFVVLITSSIFISIPRELEEAGVVFGLSPLQVFVKITLPLATPGLAAAAMFAFLISWNEVVAATILSYLNRTLPAMVLTPYVMGTGGELPDPYKFAAATIMIVPALVFMAYIRKYLTAMWGAAGVK